MFRVSQHQSSGVLKTVPAASVTGHNTGTATSLQRGLIRPRFSTADDGCCDTRNMQYDFAVINVCKLFHLVGFLLTQSSAY